MQKFFWVEGGRVHTCTQPSKTCEHEHYYFLARAAREVAKTFYMGYHLNHHGEIERCENESYCLLPHHFKSRREAVQFHRATYDFSGRWRALENPYVSLIEQEFSQFVEKLGFQQVNNSRSVIAPYEVDVYLPTREVAFEFNGDFWHSEEQVQQRYGLTPRAYHLKKLNRCYEQGIKLGFVWEQNWVQDWLTVVDAVSDFIQFRRDSPLLTQLDRPLSPADVFWEKVDREGIELQRAKVEKRMMKKLPKEPTLDRMASQPLAGDTP